MIKFKYETHAHTSLVSKCSRISPIQLVDLYKSLDYTGIFITDHFLNGNTTVEKDMTWTERINLYCLGYEKAFEYGNKVGLDVFFGWEYTYKGTDFLTYGLDKSWLLSHPALLELSVNDYCDLVHDDGGLIVQAHPFREAGYIDMIRLLPRKVDAVEVINSERTDFENKMALEYANNYGLPHFAGSDIHAANRSKLAGIEVLKKFNCEKDLAVAIKSGEYSIFEDSYK